MNLTKSQKDLLLRLQYESLPTEQEARFAEDINVLLSRGFLSRDQHDPFARLYTSDYGSSVLDAMELTGKL